MSYQDILISNGFYKWHSCTCVGTLRERWKRKTPHDLEFTIYPKRNTIETKIRKVIVCRTGLENLQSEIEKYLK